MNPFFNIHRAVFAVYLLVSLSDSQPRPSTSLKRAILQNAQVPDNVAEGLVSLRADQLNALIDGRGRLLLEEVLHLTAPTYEGFAQVLAERLDAFEEGV